MWSHHAYTIVYIQSVAGPPMSTNVKATWQSLNDYLELGKKSF
jgi:hypothetical protein